MSITLSTLFYSSLAGIATIVGIHIIRLNGLSAKKYAKFLMPFAAGIILAVAFLHLIPEAIEHNKNSVIYVFIGFLVFYLLESGLIMHAGPELHHMEHNDETKLFVSSQMAFIGLLVHSFIDGLIIGVSFEIDSTIGMFTTFSIIMHELPEGVTTYSLLAIVDSEKKALVKSYIVALATPVGAIISLLFIKTLTEPSIGILLALASGSFIYVAASDLIPETHNHKSFKNILFLFLGVALIYFATNMLHQH
ncbi:MAG: ZIP family metal transporter [Desulfobacterales bacterium]|nr:ZIP family metal transporter [Desulfobacterales bacterium]MCP4161708.1 ZIP family metal transporter [Deltaproteobacteria bacterium]